MKRNKGFTIVELLIVFAIITLLIAIILVALSGSRNKAKDAKIKQLMAEIRNTADIYHISQIPNTYVGLGSYADIATIKAAVVSAGGTSLAEFYTTDKYCVQYNLNVTGAWCVDGAGYRGIIANCDEVNYNCAAD